MSPSAFLGLLGICHMLTSIRTSLATEQSLQRQRSPPNIVFLIVESTDGRTWRPGYQDSVIPLPNIQKLGKASGGAQFVRHYANSPVCCTSRSTLWSGRHAHNIPHTHRRGECEGMKVDGVWNNYEGLPANYSNRIDQILSRDGGYDVHLSGKTDFTEGSHTLNVRLASWTKQVRFPYDMNETGGFRYDYAQVCRSNGTVLEGNRSAHYGDWKVLEQNLDWLKNRTASSIAKEKPFFLYQGFNIVHPPYVTNEFYYNQIDPEKIHVPIWVNLTDMHPCDLQSSMLKGCIPSDDERAAVEDYYRRRNVRRIYYSMIREFDDMVGRYIDAVKDAGLSNDTVFIVTSDHGDMQLEHRQTFKMTPYEGSATVPMVIYDPRKTDRSPVVVFTPTQLIDLFPTILEYGQVLPATWPRGVEGRSLVPLVESYTQWNRTFVVSQFHGVNIAMSWFLIVKDFILSDGQSKTYKLVIYGTGVEVESQLFDLTLDPDELRNLSSDPKYSHIVATLDRDLRSIVEYDVVAKEVAAYDKQSFRCWVNNVTGDWRNIIHSSDLRWADSFNYDSDGAFKALQEWLSGDDSILPCRSAQKWPPSDITGTGTPSVLTKEFIATG